MKKVRIAHLYISEDIDLDTFIRAKVLAEKYVELLHKINTTMTEDARQRVRKSLNEEFIDRAEDPCTAVGALDRPDTEADIEAAYCIDDDLIAIYKQIAKDCLGKEE